QFLFTLKKQGKLALAGPITDDNSIRGIMIFNSDNKDEVKTILDADPFVKRGHFRVVILNFFGLPGDTLP
ncbi:MAG: YciI family protein, partial [Bacteroidota bacterium]